MSLDSGYLKWLSKHLWNKGDQLYADDISNTEIEKIAFQISIKNEIAIVPKRYKGNFVFLLYVHKNEFPLIPTKYYYHTLDNIDGEMFPITDMISIYKQLHQPS